MGKASTNGFKNRKSDTKQVSKQYYNFHLPLPSAPVDGFYPAVTGQFSRSMSPGTHVLSSAASVGL